VLATDGPVLVVAGPGTGKTHTLSTRLAYLIQARGVPPERLLAVTFTTRAAREMNERLRKRLGGPARPLLGTFHGLCFKWLRAEGHRLGLPEGFGICDPRDQAAILQECLRAQAPADGRAHAQAALQELSRVRNQALDPEPMLAELGLLELYRAYAARLRSHGLLDYDDLLTLVVRLLELHPEVCARLRAQYAYLSVDEYQDVNPLQYRLLRLLAVERPNLWAVGDADQAIYAFRGAQVENFLRFEHDFPGSRVIRLERSYRSSPQIVAAASQVIARNAARVSCALRTENPPGPLIQVISLPDEEAEAAWLVREIEERVGGTSHYQHYKGGVKDTVATRRRGFRDLAVLYRLNALARPLEEAFARSGIPYRVVGGTRYFDRKAVRDALAYLRVLRHPEDDMSLRRILNVPPRGIGRETQTTLETEAERRGLPLCRALQTESPSRGVEAFLRLWGALQDGMADHALSRYLSWLLDITGLERWHTGQDGRRENDFLLLRALAAQYDDLPLPEALDRFLAETTLAAEADDYDPAADAVTLMTLHAAKGLEFEEVFLCGLEEDILPSAGADPEEERRLFYVGLTRARERIHLLACRRRFLFGERRERPASRFLAEFDDALKEQIVVPDRPRATEPESPQLALF
jgi:DNA helicase-2/ATP-dependent DNA helicase PcrA